MVGLDIFAPPPQVDQDVVLWRENANSAHFFASLGSRWIYGSMGGVLGLRWEAIYPLMDRIGLCREAWDALRFDLEVMEGAALEEIAKKR